MKKETGADGLELETVFLLSLDSSFITTEDFYPPVLLVVLVAMGIPEHYPGKAGALLCLSATLPFGNGCQKCETAHPGPRWLILTPQAEH